MSEMEKVKGKIKKIQGTPEEVENFAKEKCLEYNSKAHLAGYSSWKSRLTDFQSDNFMKIDNDLYEVIELENRDTDESYCDLTFNEDGTISFETLFYNGGANEQEMIGDEMRRIKNGK